VADDFECLAGRLSRHIYGITIFESLTRLEIRYALSRIGNADFSGKMALLADAVPRGPAEFRWIDYRPRHGLRRMSFTRPVATIARDAFRQKGRRLILV
jgi:hypothetical protein